MNSEDITKLLSVGVFDTYSDRGYGPSSKLSIAKLIERTFMNDRAKVNIGILGLGTVGSGTVNLLARNADEIARRAGRTLKVTQASARDLSRPRACNLDGIKLTSDPFKIVNDPSIDIVVELIGGIDAANDLMIEAIANGKHVVTANKALVAERGNEIFLAASRMQVVVAFEAAVAGGIPIIKLMREGLSGNKVEWLAGIINGTGNFILTEMRDKNRDFNEVLKEAQALGYAEADPTFDVDGTDAAHKLAILASIAFGNPLRFESVYKEGITAITEEDVNNAEELGYRIKHLGIAKKGIHGVELRVHPTLIPERRLLANVDGVKNAILVQGDAVGPTLYYGAGAGANPTASAVVSDLVDLVRTLSASPEHRVPYLAFQPEAVTDFPIMSMDMIRTAFYLRLLAVDKPGVLAEVAGILAEREISIEAVVQKEPKPQQHHVNLILLTHPVNEGSMNEALKKIELLPTIKGPVTRIRVEQLDVD